MLTSIDFTTQPLRHKLRQRTHQIEQMHSHCSTRWIHFRMKSLSWAVHGVQQRLHTTFHLLKILLKALHPCEHHPGTSCCVLTTYIHATIIRILNDGLSFRIVASKKCEFASGTSWLNLPTSAYQTKNACSTLFRSARLLSSIHST